MDKSKPGVSAEESKAQRLKRQQARFRDRGGAFVPSNLNPLVDILLARTVSGESPSKARPKGVAPKRRSPSKPRRPSLAHKAEENQPVAGNSKSKAPSSRKRTVKPVEPEADQVVKPAAKRRGRPAKKNVSDSTDKQSKSSSKGKGKPPIASAPSTSEHVKAKPKPRAKTTCIKEVVEVLRSDDDQTLVEVPHKAKSIPVRKIRPEDDSDTDDMPLVPRRAKPPAGGLDASVAQTSKRVVTEKIPGTTKSGQKLVQGEREKAQDEGLTNVNAKKRSVRYEDEEDAVPRPVKKKRATKSRPIAESESESEPEPAKTNANKCLVRHDDDNVEPPPVKKGRAAKSKTVIEFESETVPCPTSNVTNGQNLEIREKGRGKGREDAQRDVEDRPLKSKKRKQEEDNYDDRPCKTVKFAEPGPPHSSSHTLKENRSDRKRKNLAKEDPGAVKPATLSLRTRTSKGPPREVLDRIKASAARHLRCADNEPDELDCLS